MRNLVRVQLLASLGLNTLFRGRKRLRTLLLAGLFVFFMLPAYSGYISLLYKSYRFLSLHQPELYPIIISGLYVLAQWMTLVVGLPIIYATLQKSHDLAILLPLPYRPLQILAAKLSVTYLLELLFDLAFMAPAFVLHVAYAHPRPETLVAGIISLLLLPAIPLAISGILFLGILNLPGIGKNKWFWHLALVLSLLSASFAFSALTTTGATPVVADFVQVKLQQMNRLGRFLPGSVLALRAMTGSGIAAVFNLVIYVLVVGSYLLALLLLGEKLYFRPFLKGSGGASRRSRRGEPAYGWQVSGFLSSYVRKETACIFKDPAVAMNALGGYITLPILLVTYTIMKVQSKGKVDIIGQVMSALHGPGLANHLPIVVIGLGLALAFLGTSSSLFSASYSKDGKRLWVEKSLPIAPYDIFKGKLLAGLAPVTALNLLVLVALGLITHLNAWQLGYVFLLSETIIIYSAAIGLMIDCARPKLVWKDTVQAVKQNLNVVFGMLATVTALGLNAGILWILFEASVAPAVIYVLILAVNLVLLLVALEAGKRAASRLEQVEV